MENTENAEPKQTQKLILNLKPTTAHRCVHIITYNCRTQHSTEQF